MKNALLNLLRQFTPSRIILNNCMELIRREQTGLAKYGVSLTDAPLTHEQVLQHLLEEQLDAANYTRKALMTASKAHVDYAMLRMDLKTAQNRIANLRGSHAGISQNDDALDAYAAAIRDAGEILNEMLFRFDSGKVQRDLRK